MIALPASSKSSNVDRSTTSNAETDAFPLSEFGPNSCANPRIWLGRLGTLPIATNPLRRSGHLGVSSSGIERVARRTLPRLGWAMFSLPLVSLHLTTHRGRL